MEQNDSQKNAGNNCAKSDGRTFLIALLTSIIVLALYHFGTGVFAIFTGNYDSCCSTPVAREYVLVPVSSMPQPCMGGMMGRGPGKFGGFHHRGGFRHGGFHHRGGFRHGGFHRGEQDGKCGDMPRFGKHGFHRGEQDGKRGDMPHFGKHGFHHGAFGHHPGAPVKPDAAPAKPDAPVKPDAAPAKPEAPAKPAAAE